MPDIKCIRNANINGEIKDILILEGKVVDIGKEIPHCDCEYDAEGRVTIPGLIDCHMHMDKSLLNEQSPYVDVSGAEKGAFTRELKKSFTIEDVTERAERIIQKAISSGTLAVRTNVDVDSIVELRSIEAMINLREKYKDIITIQVAAFAQEGIFSDGKTDKLLEEAIKMGADLVGGHTITCGEGEKHIDFILNLARKYDIDADFHLDESGNIEHYLLPYLTDKIIEMKLQGRVNAIHLCTLANVKQDELATAMSCIKNSGLKATIAPTAISTRALAPVKELVKTGMDIGLGSDNIRDFFNPLGSGDIKHAALLLSYIQRFFTTDEVAQIWNMLTYGGAKVLKIDDYDIKVGSKANITIFDAKTPQEVIAYQAKPSLILRLGKTILY